jgi:predicted ATPase/DNA-binding CsgD family transcriptional regulator
VGYTSLRVDPLIGREAEVLATMALLDGRARLLTLTGPPGVGKTRLAMELLARCSGRFPDGGAFVDLSSARDHVGALGEVARSLGVGTGARASLPLHQSLAERDILLVLDNAEQVVDLPAEIEAILRDCPRVHLIVTSRENMHLSQEREFSVPPLAMPSGDDLHHLERLAAVPSVALFLSLARTVRPDFTLTADNADAIAEICIRLDGLPLALTLAAARVKMFNPGDIATRLRDRRALLEATSSDVPARHRTLRSAISWSHAVLGASERRLFRRLSIFAEPWSIADAETICGDPRLDVVAALTSLVDKSLVQTVGGSDGTSRFVLLESLREYGAEQLDRYDERGDVAARHAAYYIEQARGAEASVGSSDESAWWEVITGREGDFRAAFDRCMDAGDGNGALALAAALGWARYLHGELGSGQDLVNQALRLAEQSSEAPDPALHTAALIGNGVLSWGRGELAIAGDQLRQALRECEERHDLRHLAIAKAFLGHVARDRGDFEEAAALHEDAARLYDHLASAGGSAWARFDLGRVAWQRGDLETAAALLRDALSRFRGIDYPWAVAWSAWALGNVNVELGDLDDGAQLISSALQEFAVIPDLRGVASCWECLATVALERGRYHDGLHLLGAAGNLRRRLAAPLSQSELGRVQRAEDRAREKLGDFTVDREQQEGRTLPTAAVHELAQSIAKPTEPPAQPMVEHNLTPREQEVVALVAAGHTNQQIGNRLGITARTAEAHVHNIMSKLDARSRAEVAVWAVKNDVIRGPAPD